MEEFFLQHSVLQDRDPDELRGRVNSDLEASENEEVLTDRVHSVADPTGPWKQTPVNDEAWGRPNRSIGGRKRREFASTHTGPKGVINDYKAHKRYQKQERLKKEQERQAALNRMVKGAVCTTSSVQDLTKQCDGESYCECEDCEFADDAFMAEYTQLRLKQMQEQVRSRPVYGDLQFISPEQFVTLTADDTSRISSMLVHLYHPDNYACGLLNSQLAVVARKLVHVKFVAMVAKEADATIEMRDLPIVLIFRNQQQQETIVDVTRRLEGEFTLERVEAFVNEQL